MMLAARRALQFGIRLSALPKRGCASAVPVDDAVNGLTDEQIQVAKGSVMQTEKKRQIVHSVVLTHNLYFNSLYTPHP